MATYSARFVADSAAVDPEEFLASCRAATMTAIDELMGQGVIAAADTNSLFPNPRSRISSTNYPTPNPQKGLPMVLDSYQALRANVRRLKLRHLNRLIHNLNRFQTATNPDAGTIPDWDAELADLDRNLEQAIDELEYTRDLITALAEERHDMTSNIRVVIHALCEACTDDEDTVEAADR